MKLFCVLGTLAVVTSAGVQNRSLAADAEAQPVPRGIKGARFGMSKQQLLKAQPGLVKVKEHPATKVEEQGVIVSLAGFQLHAETSLGRHGVGCQFDFTTQERLTRVRCYLSTGDGRATHDLIRTEFLVFLSAKYGTPHKAGHGCKDKRPGMIRSFKCKGQWVWLDEQASLTLDATYSELSTIKNGSLTFTNAAVEYDQAVKRAREQARKIRAERVAKEQRDEETLERYKRPLHEDL